MTLSEDFLAYIQVLRFGNCIITGIPAEPFCSMGIRIKEMLQPYTAMVTGYANGYLGYIGPESSWKNKGYEFAFGPWSKIGSEGYEAIISAVRELSAEVRII
jgi:hypothetical protein